MTRVLMVCLGNICRSPTAEAVFARMLEDEGLADRVEVASAGTGAWHVGNPPDERSAAAAARRGITLRGTAQQVRHQDFQDYDLLVAMDASNRRDLLRLAGDDQDARAKVVLLRELDPEADETDVPDPYWTGGPARRPSGRLRHPEDGGPTGFDDVLDVVESGCRGLLTELRARGLA